MSIKRELDLLAGYAKGFGIDVGCGRRPIGNAMGVDIARDSAAIIDAEAYDLPFRDGVLDYVVSSHSFEHYTVAPLITLREWARTLKIGGVCGVVVPNAEYGMWVMGSVDGIPGQLCKTMSAMEHMHCFTTQTLRLLFEFAGFKVVRCEVIDRRPDWEETTILCVGLKTDSFVGDK